MTDADVLDRILLAEGGDTFTNDPRDAGGATKYGVTARTLGEWRHLGRQATVAEVEALTEADARAIYTARYLRPFAAVSIAPLRAQLADFGVTSGPATAIKALQRVLGVTVDGVIGDETLTAIQVAPWRLTQNALVGARCKFYSDLAERHPKDRAFLRGWIRRAVECLV